MNDDVLMTVKQIVEHFGVTLPAVRAWIAAGLIEPVVRRGQGRSGVMYFTRGSVVSLMHGICPECGGGFRRATLRQKWCSAACRKKANSRLH